MEIVCESCNSNFNIPDHKLPQGKTASFACPKCKNRITINPNNSEELPVIDTSTGDDDSSLKESSLDDDVAGFRFVEEEGKTALVCITDPSLIKQVASVLDLMEYHVTDAEDTRDALKKMRFQSSYNLIVVDDNFDNNNPESNGVILYLKSLPMASRRDIFIAVITQRFRTMDNLNAYHNSINLFINRKNMDEFGKLLERGIMEYEVMYRVYKESMKKLGMS
ncbi:MAG: zinc-ribbon domain-containing protein [Desulfobacterales bacterium]|nr:zinc-ribbon domain-containing protein [Desulfobacterales bacterium]